MVVVPLETAEMVAAAMNDGKVDMAALRADGGLPHAALGVAILHQNIAVLLARSSLNVEAISDLRNKTVGILGRGAANEALFTKILNHHGVSPADMRMFPVDTLDALRELAEKESLDAIFLAGPRGGRGPLRAYKAFEELSDAPPTVISIADTSALLIRNRGLAKGEIVAGEFGNNPTVPQEAVTSLTFPALLVARRQLSSDVVQEFTNQLFSLRNGLAQEHPIGEQVAALDTDRGSPFAVHPGAEVYYDASEVPFLEKYSDFMWFAFFGMGSVTSAVAWLWSRALPRRRELIQAERKQIIQLLNSARRAGTLAEISDLEQQADALLVAVSEQIFSGVLDVDQQKPAFDMLFERLSMVLDERRRQIEARPGI